MKPATEGIRDPRSVWPGLEPAPPSSVRLTKRAGILALGVLFVVVAAIGYGILTRSGRSIASGFQPAEVGLTAATDAGTHCYMAPRRCGRHNP